MTSYSQPKNSLMAYTCVYNMFEHIMYNMLPEFRRAGFKAHGRNYISLLSHDPQTICNSDLWSFIIFVLPKHMI